MSTPTKAERQNSAQKAAATRHGNKAAQSITDARTSANTAFGHARKSVWAVRDAAVYSVKSVASRAQAVLPGS